MVHMNAKAVEFEIKRLQECCVQYRDDIKILERRVVTLEDRLEVYSTSDAQGKRLYLGIGDCDGIGCRDETIKLLDKRIESLSAKLDSAWADSSAWEASANSYKEEACRLKLVAGRYQFMWEKAQLCINKIDDHFEYAHAGRTPDQLQAEVRKHLATYTEAISKSKRGIQAPVDRPKGLPMERRLESKCDHEMETSGSGTYCVKPDCDVNWV